MESPNQHKSVRDFMARRGLAATAMRADGRLTLVIDGRYRIHLRPGSGGQLTLTANVMPLPGDPGSPASQQVVERLMNSGAGMLRDHASTLCLDREAGMLQLQQSLSGDLTGIELDAEIGEFTNALHFWVRTGNSL
ncbi:CesT family type III secretion system chaperone [Propionivibrio soli]|uniref:CesT family type III secretion system chaperone n=1 Tax=Propionivibrio soli TaxID=2976531 RepID=UPI0021E88834|nr:CesT family type III secretion system chaperone [Propionivibrio soli]